MAHTPGPWERAERLRVERVEWVRAAESFEDDRDWLRAARCWRRASFACADAATASVYRRMVERCERIHAEHTADREMDEAKDRRGAWPSA